MQYGRTWSGADGANGPKHRLAFGGEIHEIGLPDDAEAIRIVPACPSPPVQAVDEIRRALEHPIGSERLCDMARGRKTAVILIPGKDRVAATEIFMPLVLDELNEAGIPDEAISVVVATGTHAVHSLDDMKRLLGAEAFARVRCRQHDCKSGRHLKTVGITRYGTPVEFDGAVVEAGIRVLTGRIIPHYFAGFGGGRKALLPGVASVATILRNHRLTLDPNRGIHPAIRPCSLEGNPVHLDMLEAASFAGPTFVLNTLLDSEHRLVSAVAGALDAAHLAGCRLAEDWFKVALDRPVDAVIASAGGNPYDCDFVQSLKALFDVQDIVRPGGAILCSTECRAGMKEDFLSLAAIEDDDKLETAVRAHYTLAGHNSVMLRRLLRRTRVALHSALPDSRVRALGIEPVRSLYEGLAWLRDACSGGTRYAVVPFANVTYATLKGVIP